ncbi:MAG: hypothetical protein RLZZ283_462 [Candidatus Parcubacteria bacterium]|jgi:hypothetical protein
MTNERKNLSADWLTEEGMQKYEKPSSRPKGWMSQDDMTIAVGHVIKARPAKLMEEFLQQIPHENESQVFSSYRRGKPWFYYHPEIYKMFCLFLIQRGRLSQNQFEKIFPPSV